MKVECERWVGLSDLEACGEPLAFEAREFLRAHAPTCAACGREAAIWRSLPGAAGVPSHPASPRSPVLRHRLAELE
jgi:hypothetical protein